MTKIKWHIGRLHPIPSYCRGHLCPISLSLCRQHLVWTWWLMPLFHHVENRSTSISRNSRPGWFICCVPSQPGLRSETLSQKKTTPFPNKISKGKLNMKTEPEGLKDAKTTPGRCPLLSCLCQTCIWWRHDCPSVSAASFLPNRAAWGQLPLGGRGESAGDQWLQWGQTMDILACSRVVALGMCEGPICNLIFTVA